MKKYFSRENLKLFSNPLYRRFFLALNGTSDSLSCGPLDQPDYYDANTMGELECEPGHVMAINNCYYGHVFKR